jgi:D-tyrosyl-tRNA(Tyr) deacylase
VSVGGEVVGEIGGGLLVFLGLDRNDDETAAARLVDKVLNYRLFPDPQGRMNLSVLDIAGGVLVISQFTLSADTRKGLRPSFTSAMPPAEAEQLYDSTVALFRRAAPDTRAGIFAADMQVALVNDGPVTFLLEV